MIHNIQGNNDTLYRLPWFVCNDDSNLDSILGFRFVSVWSASAAARTYTAAATDAAIPYHTAISWSASAVASTGFAQRKWAKA